MTDELEKKADEIKKVGEEVPEETPVKSVNVGNKPKATTLIDGANTAAERLEAANAKMEALISRQEEATAKQMLAGRAEAGGQSIEKTQDDKDEEDANKFLEQLG